MDILIEDNNDFSDFNDSSEDDNVGSTEDIKSRRNLRQMKGALKNLLAKPIFPKGFSYKYPTAELINNELNERSNHNAVNVMKEAMKETNKKQKSLY